MEVSTFKFIFENDPVYPDRIGYIDNVDAFREAVAYEKNQTGENAFYVFFREGRIAYKINQETPIRIVTFDDEYCEVEELGSPLYYSGSYDAMLAKVDSYFVEVWLGNDDLFRAFFRLDGRYMVDLDYNQILEGSLTVDVLLPVNTGNLRAVHKHTSKNV